MLCFMIGACSRWLNSWIHNGWWKTCSEFLRRKMNYRFLHLDDCRKRSFRLQFSVLIVYNTASRPLWFCAHIHAIQFESQIWCLADPCWHNVKNYVLKNCGMFIRILKFGSEQRLPSNTRYVTVNYELLKSFICLLPHLPCCIMEQPLSQTFLYDS